MIHRQIRELLSNCNFLPKEKLSSCNIYIYIYKSWTIIIYLISNTKLDCKGKTKENIENNVLMIYNELHSHTRIFYLIQNKIMVNNRDEH